MNNFYFPDGSTLHIGTGLAAVKNVTAISNANPAVCTSTAHGLANGDVIVFSCDYPALDNRIFKVQNLTADTFALVGVDTRDTKIFPAGQGASASGAGKFQKVNGFAQIRNIAELTASGGEPQYATVSFLDVRNEIQVPTTNSPRSIQAKIADNPTMEGYKAAKAASDARVPMPLRLDLVSGGQIFYNGYMSLNEMPSMGKGQLATVDFACALVADFTRYG